MTPEEAEERQARFEIAGLEHTDSENNLIDHDPAFAGRVSARVARMKKDRLLAGDTGSPPPQYFPAEFGPFLLQWKHDSDRNEARLYLESRTRLSVLEIRSWRESAVRYAVGAGSHQILYQRRISGRDGPDFAEKIFRVLTLYGCTKERYRQYLEGNHLGHYFGQEEKTV